MSAIQATTVRYNSMADGTLRLTIDVEPRDALDALTLFREPGTAMGIARLTRQAAGAAMAETVTSEARPGGQMMKDIIAHGVFNNPKVLAALGTDEQFQDYVRGLPSCLDGNTHGIAYAHVRRANNSGTSIKPDYSGVPLTDEQHKLQHNNGEAAALDTWKAMFFENGMLDPWRVDAAKIWFDKQAAKCRIDWGKTRMLEQWNDDGNGFTSLAEIDPASLVSWFSYNDLTNALPARWRDA